jgi:hypothetical protein
MQENGGGSDRATSSASPPFGSAAMTTIRGLIPDESAPHFRDLCMRRAVAIYVCVALPRFLCAPHCRDFCVRRAVAIYVCAALPRFLCTSHCRMLPRCNSAWLRD